MPYSYCGWLRNPFAPRNETMVETTTFLGAWESNQKPEFCRLVRNRFRNHRTWVCLAFLKAGSPASNMVVFLLVSLEKTTQVISPTACGALFGALFSACTTPQPSRTSWNPRIPGGTLVEPWWNSGGTLVSPWWKVEPWWNAGGTLVEPWWNPGGTLVEPWWNPGGTLVEPSWNLTSGPPRTTPEPIWAETPKLSAVGE